MFSKLSIKKILLVICVSFVFSISGVKAESNCKFVYYGQVNDTSSEVFTTTTHDYYKIELTLKYSAESAEAVGTGLAEKVLGNHKNEDGLYHEEILNWTSINANIPIIDSRDKCPDYLIWMTGEMVDAFGEDKNYNKFYATNQSRMLDDAVKLSKKSECDKVLIFAVEDISKTCQYFFLGADPIAYFENGYITSVKALTDDTSDPEASVSYVFELHDSIKDQNLLEATKGECPELVFCETPSSLNLLTNYEFMVFGNDLDYKKYASTACGDGHIFGLLDNINGKTDGVGTCITYDRMLESLKENYMACKDNRDPETCASYLVEKSIFEGLCSSVTGYLNYDDECLSRCLNLGKDISEFDKFAYDNSYNDCGFSNDLMKWVRNILRWIKYILPALVILLGILDFIRAIASNSEDEMKKAQQRFIKRLVAAAILFLVPFIIEFALNIFGIGVDNPFCGLTD